MEIYAKLDRACIELLISKKRTLTSILHHFAKR